MRMLDARGEGKKKTYWNAAVPLEYPEEQKG
jgi:hypothetical protein